MEVKEAIQTRRSVKKYDANYVVDDDALRELFRLVVLSPSSYNLQHWKFVVLRDPTNKKALRAASYNQPQVEEASAVVVVCGNRAAYKDADRLLSDMPDDVRAKSVEMIKGAYEGNEQIQHDEPIRSGALAAMTLMLAAKEMGLATGPMIGFDPQAVSKLLKLDADHFPVMMVVLGKERGQMRARAYRRPLEEVVKLESFDEPGLE